MNGQPEIGVYNDNGIENDRSVYQSSVTSTYKMYFDPGTNVRLNLPLMKPCYGYILNRYGLLERMVQVQC